MKFILPIGRARAHAAIDDAPAGWVVRLSEPAKSREQENLYHELIGEIAKRFEHAGRKWDEESMKRLLIDQFRRETARDPELGPLWDRMGTMEIAPSLDGTGLVSLGWQSRRFPKQLASAFIEWLRAFMVEKI